MGKSKGRAQQFAELDVSITKDFDPEEDAPAPDTGEDSTSGDSDDGLAGTEHYIEVSKSKLRRRDEVTLGPQYDGSQISREQLLNDDDEDNDSQSSDEETEDETRATAKFADPEDVDLDIDEDDDDIDSDAAFGDSDTEKFKDFTFRGSSKLKAVNGGKSKRPTAADFMSDSEDEVGNDSDSEDDEADEDILNVDEQDTMEADEGSPADSSHEEDEEDQSEGDQDSAVSEHEQSDESKSENGDDEKARRAELRKIMNEEQKTVVATISQAAKVDADKGNAVQQQRKAFDSLLSVRMVLQKALIATNSMATSEDEDGDSMTNAPYQAAEDAAIKLWNTLEGIRQEVIKASSDTKTGQKRKRDIDTSTSSTKIWSRMQVSEVASIDIRQRTLEKWWDKVRGSTVSLAGKLNNNVVPQSLTSVIQDQLAKPESLKRTKRPRSCAPAQEKLKVIEDQQIYDDTTLYKTLLNQLVDQRKMDSGPAAGGGNGTPAQWAVKEAKMRKNVDTKASKGRKMRYTVHEKLQNFMAPEDRATWEQDAVDRFFGTLLGRKMTLGEEDMDVDEDEDEISPEEQGLKLFR